MKPCRWASDTAGTVPWHALCVDSQLDLQRTKAMTCPLCADFLIPAGLTILVAFVVAALL